MRFVLSLSIILLVAGIVGTVEVEAQEAKEIDPFGKLRVNAERSRSIELEKIIVSSRRTQIGLSEATENVTVINEDEIKGLPARNLGEVIRYISGVGIEPHRGFGRVASSFSIQGSDTRHVRVMIDGIPLNPQSSGDVDLSRFPIENIKRIEVIKGASSSLWGSALGGVINIITKDTGESLIPEGSFTDSFSEFHTKKESFDLSGKSGDLGYYQFCSYMESGGDGPKDDVLEKKTFSKLSYDLKDNGKVTASFGYSNADVNSGEYPDGKWEAKPYRVRYGKIGWEAVFNNYDIKVDLKHSRQELTTKTFSSIADKVPSSIRRFNDMLYQLSLNLTTYPGERDLLVLGGDFDWDILKSTYLSEGKSLNLQAPYVNYTLKLRPWDLNLGLRYDHNSEFGEQFSPSLGAAYHLENLSDTLIRAGFSRAFNAPPLLWKYYDESLSWITINPDIEPERAWVYELGVETQPTHQFWSKLSLYRADVSDAISTAQNESAQYYKKNFQKFRRQGVELQFKIDFCEELSFSGGGSFNDVEDRSTKKTRKDIASPRQSFNLGVEYKNKRGFDVYLNGYYDYWNNTFDIYEPNDSKFIFDMKLTQKIGGFTWFLNIHNLTNSKYWSDYFNPIPERYFEGGVTYRW